MQGPASWSGKYYKYRLEVYSPWSQRMEVLEATDPYSRSLAADGARTQVGVCLRLDRLSSQMPCPGRDTSEARLAPVVCNRA